MNTLWHAFLKLSWPNIGKCAFELYVCPPVYTQVVLRLVSRWTKIHFIWWGKRAKFSLYSSLWHTVGVEVYLHSFLISALDDGDCKASQAGPFIFTETAFIACWLRGWIGSRFGRGVLEKSLVPAGIRMPGHPSHLLVKSFLKVDITFQFWLIPVNKPRFVRRRPFLNKFPLLNPIKAVKYLSKRKSG